MSEKKLLNERILGMAGIIPMPSLGFTTNAPVKEGKWSKDELDDEDQNAKCVTELNVDMGRVMEFAGLKDKTDIPAGYELSENVEDELDQEFIDIVDNYFEFGGDEWATIEALDSLIKQGFSIDEMISRLKEAAQKSKNQNIKGKLEWFAHTLDTEMRPGQLDETTRKQTLGMIKTTSNFKSHRKDLIQERMLGIVGLKPIGGLQGCPSQHSFKKAVNEMTSDLSRAELFNKLPMLHSDSIMKLAEDLDISPSGKKWDRIVEEITDAYFCGASSKQIINNSLQTAGLA